MCGENSVHYWETPYAQPFFDNTTKRDITATVGQPALLHCRVRNLGDRAVSFFIQIIHGFIVAVWERKRICVEFICGALSIVKMWHPITIFLKKNILRIFFFLNLKCLRMHNLIYHVNGEKKIVIVNLWHSPQAIFIIFFEIQSEKRPMAFTKNNSCFLCSFFFFICLSSDMCETCTYGFDQNANKNKKKFL